MNCPNCNVVLVMSERQGIEIDFCPNCRGVWLDRGELDKIIERSTNSQGQPIVYPNREPNQGHDYKHGDYYKNKRKGWLQDLFD